MEVAVCLLSRLVESSKSANPVSGALPGLMEIMIRSGVLDSEVPRITICRCDEGVKMGDVFWGEVPREFRGEVPREFRGDLFGVLRGDFCGMWFCPPFMTVRTISPGLTASNTSA